MTIPTPAIPPVPVPATPPAAAVVVVPAHDEAELLDACLHALTRAVDHAHAAYPDVIIAAVVVLDACTDDSEAVARRWPLEIVVTDAGRVGTARRVGIRHALDALDTAPEESGKGTGATPAATWIATTDADSTVPENWLTHQLDLMSDGADLVLGTVRPDFADLSERHVAYWTSTHTRGMPPGNVHGANLGLRASTYLAAGGFPDLAEHEDAELVRAAVARGAAVRATDENEVVTSGRFAGRTPGGYAMFLRDVDERLTRAASGE